MGLTGGVSDMWLIRSGGHTDVVAASDQWGAWDTWRGRPVGEFGLVAEAERNENADPIYVQTATLMRRWGRDVDAFRFDDLAREKGLL